MSNYVLFDRIVTLSGQARVSVAVERDADVLLLCQKGRALAQEFGFDDGDQVAIAIAISELARNVLAGSGKGQITLHLARQKDTGSQGIAVVAQGAGRATPYGGQDPERSQEPASWPPADLSGARRLMDEIEIESEADQGTTVTLRKWLQ
jgi:serine/threonine-protein kinase RsbT